MRHILYHLLSWGLGAFATPFKHHSEFADSINLHKRCCARDNLLRCLDPTAQDGSLTRASATEFCSSYLSIPMSTSTVSIGTTTTTTTTATNYLTTTIPLVIERTEVGDLIACTSNYAPAQLSSACSCLSITPSTTYTTAIATTTVTMTTTVTVVTTVTPECTPPPIANYILDPGFEFGSSSWSNSTYGLNDPPAFSGVVDGGFDSDHAYSVTAGRLGTGALLSQHIAGLTVGRTYTFSYIFRFTPTGISSSISCGIDGVGLSSESVTNDTPDTWRKGPDWYGGSFTAKATSGTFECVFVSGGAITWKVDNFYIGI